jgi:pilus assembly protein Flp/PilA
MVFLRKERGQGMVEYSLLIVLLALVVIIAITLMGTSLSTLYSQISSKFPMH